MAAAVAAPRSTADVRALEPRPLFGFFADLAALPRPSKKEQRWGAARARGFVAGSGGRDAAGLGSARATRCPPARLPAG